MSEKQHDQSQPADEGKRRKPIRTRWLLLATAVITLCLISLIYALAFFNEPELKVDYLAKINAPALAVPEEDRAWPLYRELLLRYNLANMSVLPGYGPARELVVPHEENHTDHDLNDGDVAIEQPAVPKPSGEPEYTYDGFNVPIETDDIRWPETVESLKAHAALFEQIRQATQKPLLGLVIQQHYTGDDELALTGQTGRTITTHDNLIEELFISDHVAFYVTMRRFAQLIEVDINLAIYQKDWPRVLANLQAFKGLALHSRQPALAIGELISISIAHYIPLYTNRLLVHHANELPDAQLRELISFLQSLDELAVIDLEPEKYFSMDMLQRIYGSNGRLSYSGAQHLFKRSAFADLPPIFELAGASDTKGALARLPLLLPLLAINTANHQESIDQISRLSDLKYAHEQLPLWEILATQGGNQLQVEAWKKNPKDIARYWVVMSLHDAASQYIVIGKQSILAKRDAMLIAIALEQFRRKTGSYPPTLSMLTPDDLTSIPVDRSSGKPMLYKLVEGQPLLYGRGKNGIDEGGNFIESLKHMPLPKDGDWLLYPMPE